MIGSLKIITFLFLMIDFFNIIFMGKNNMHFHILIRQSHLNQFHFTISIKLFELNGTYNTNYPQYFILLVTMVI